MTRASIQRAEGEGEAEAGVGNGEPRVELGIGAIGAAEKSKGGVVSSDGEQGSAVLTKATRAQVRTATSCACRRRRLQAGR